MYKQYIRYKKIKYFGILNKFLLNLFRNFPKLYLVTKFKFLKIIPSDINQHLKTIMAYSKECESVFETGVRGVVSSWAIISGLYRNKSESKIFFMNDIEEIDIIEIQNICKKLRIQIKFEWIDNLKLDLDQNYDLTFIDTWHVYGQLKRELDKFSKKTNKYIILHDTSVDAEEGESLRQGYNIEQQSKESGFSIEEITKGLWPAVTEFLSSNPNWVLKKRYKNNNGLTILERVKF